MWRRRASFKAQAQEIVTEAEWLLIGHSAVGYVASGRPAPAWSLVGVLAHRSREQLQQLAMARMISDAGTWTATLAELASEVIDRAPTQGRLRELQRIALIPLELEMLGTGGARAWTPAALADLVLDVLDTESPSH